MQEKDTLYRWVIADKNIRGAFVNLHHSMLEVTSQQMYQPGIARCLCEALACNILLSTGYSLPARQILQFQGDDNSAIELLVAKYQPGKLLCGTAKWNSADCLLQKPPRLQGQLVVTRVFEQQRAPMQSIIPIDGDSVAHAIEDYFNQSEQCPTRLWVHSTEERVVAFMLAKMPADEGSQHGNDNALHADSEWMDEIEKTHRLWQEAHAQLAEDSPAENLLSAIIDLKNRQGEQREIINFACHCSHKKAINALLQMGEKEAQHLLAESHVIDIDCEFCHKKYTFSEDDVEAIFSKKS